MGRRTPAHGIARDDTGTALVEAALVLPVLLVIVAGVVMAGRVAHAQVAVQTVARESARTVAVAPSEWQGVASAQDRAAAVALGHGLALDRLDLAIDAGGFERGATVRTQASYLVQLGELPLLGVLSVTVSSSHQERIDFHRSRESAP